jgi:hypothetical protein
MLAQDVRACRMKICLYFFASREPGPPRRERGHPCLRSRQKGASLDGVGRLLFAEEILADRFSDEAGVFEFEVGSLDFAAVD